MILINIPAFMRINQLKLCLVGQQTFTSGLGSVKAERKEHSQNPCVAPSNPPGLKSRLVWSSTPLASLP